MNITQLTQRFAAVSLALAISISFAACSVFDATGESVEAVGEGAGHAVSETGRAISRSAHEIERDLED